MSDQPRAPRSDDAEWVEIEEAARAFARCHRAAVQALSDGSRPPLTEDEQRAAILARIEAWERARHRRTVRRWLWIGRAAVLALVLGGGVWYAQPALVARTVGWIETTVSYWLGLTSTTRTQGPSATAPAHSTVPRLTPTEIKPDSMLRLEMMTRLALADLDIYDVRISRRQARLRVEGTAASPAQRHAATANVTGPDVDVALTVKAEEAGLRRVSVLKTRLASLAALGQRFSAKPEPLPASERDTLERIAAVQYAGVVRELDGVRRALGLPGTPLRGRCDLPSSPTANWPSRAALAASEATALDEQIATVLRQADPSWIDTPITSQQIAARFVRTWEAMACP